MTNKELNSCCVLHYKLNFHLTWLVFEAATLDPWEAGTEPSTDRDRHEWTQPDEQRTRLPSSGCSVLRTSRWRLGSAGRPRGCHWSWFESGNNTPRVRRSYFDGGRCFMHGMEPKKAFVYCRHKYTYFNTLEKLQSLISTEPQRVCPWDILHKIKHNTIHIYQHSK